MVLRSIFKSAQTFVPSNFQNCDVAPSKFWTPPSQFDKPKPSAPFPNL